MKALLVSVVLVLVAACAGGEQISGDRRTVGSSTVVFTVNPSHVEAGRPVRFTLRIQNNSGREEEMTFMSGQRYDFWVTDGSREVWRWSDDRVFTQAIEVQKVGPQESLTLTETWTADSPGSYQAHGLVRAEGFGRALDGALVVGE